jgi:hypothetical protein
MQPIIESVSLLPEKELDARSVTKLIIYSEEVFVCTAFT